jgi:hypothetical protein
MANIVTNPTADQTIQSFNLLPAAGNTSQSLGTASAPWDAAVGTVNTIILYANNFPGATLGAQIAAACTAAGGNPAVVKISASGSITAAVTIPSNIDLVGEALDIKVTLSATGSIILSGNCAIRNLTLVNSTTTTNSVYASSASEITVENVVFQGGNFGVYFTGCSDFRVLNPVFNTTPPAGACFYFSSGGPATVVNPRVEPIVIASGGLTTQGLIYLTKMSGVSIVNPQIINVDCSNIGGAGAVRFTGCSNCSLTGGVIEGCLNCDGVLTENGSSYINISNVISNSNSSTKGTGSGHANGDGFDIFNSSHIYLSNCQAYNNGTYSGTLNEGFEIFNSYDVVCTGCVANNNGENGFQVLGSPSTKLIGCTSNYNGNNGANLQSEYGTVTTSGTTVTYYPGSGTGAGFGSNWEYGTVININGTTYNIASIANNSSLTLTTSAGTQSTPVPFNVPSRNCQVTSCYFEGNGQSGAGGSFQNGIGIAGTGANDASGRVFTGNICTDPQASQTQLYGVYIGTGSSGRGIFLFNELDGNSTGTILDSPGISPQLYDVAGTAQWVSKGVINGQNSIYGAQMVVTDVTPSVASGQIGFGTSTATTASTTAGGPALPALAAGYLEINIAGTVRKIPYYAN